MAHRGFPHPAVRHLFPPLNTLGKEVKNDLNTSCAQSPPQKSSSYTLHAVKSTYFFHFVRLHATKSTYFFHFVRLHATKSTYFFHFVRLHATKSTCFFYFVRLHTTKSTYFFHFVRLHTTKSTYFFHFVRLQSHFIFIHLQHVTMKSPFGRCRKDYVKHKTV